MIDITIPIRVPTTNELLRMHYFTRSRLLRQIANEIWVALPKEIRGRKYYLRKVRVHIERHSTIEPDPDGLDGAKKLVLDVLQPSSKRHPYGIGVIANDNSQCVESTVKHVKCKGGVKKTRIVVEAL